MPHPKNSNAKYQPCPMCNPDGSGANGGQIHFANGRTMPCPACKGEQVIPTGDGFPVPQWYPFLFTLLTTGAPGPPAVVASNAVKNPQYLSQDGNFELLEIMTDCEFPQFVQVLFEDLSSLSKFSQTPVALSTFAGDGKLPFTLPAPYTFGPKTQVQLTVNNNPIPPATQVVGIGDGVQYVAASPLTGILSFNGIVGNILPGSVTITVAGGVVVTDDGNGALTNGGNTAAGTINYATGAFTLVYVAPPAANAKITATFAQGVASQQFEIVLFGYLRIPQNGFGSRFQKTAQG